MLKCLIPQKYCLTRRDHGLPGIELSAGSLGQGLSVAVGMALADRIDKKERRVFCIMGDGEIQEGAIWEAAMSAGHYQLNSLIGIIDRNQVQIDGFTEEVMKLEPLADKWKSFNWEVHECNANDVQSINEVFERIRLIQDRPNLIIANTIMGKGISSMEGDNSWHGKAPSAEQLPVFLEELGH